MPNIKTKIKLAAKTLIIRRKYVFRQPIDFDKKRLKICQIGH